MSDSIVQRKVEAALRRLEPLFKHHKLTLVARNTSAGLDADVIVTSDDLFAVASVVTDHAHRESPSYCPGCQTVGGPCPPGCDDIEGSNRREREMESYGICVDELEDEETGEP
jgi:hypothetical protein